MAPDLSRLLQEISVAESPADIGLIAARAIEVVATLPLHQREDATECVQGVVTEWHDARKT